MAGHVFIVHGDLRLLRCDHWLLPVGAGLSASRSWNRSDAWTAIVRQLPRHMEPGQRVVEIAWDGPRRPWPTNVSSGRRKPLSWLANSVRQFLQATARAPHALRDRQRPLVALPIVGTGFGGKRSDAGDVLRVVLPQLYEAAEAHELDIALVTWTAEDFAAAQASRRRCADAGQIIWPDALGPRLQQQAQQLALLASRGRLAVFMGAGVSASAGLPTWGQLLDQLAQHAGMTDRERQGLRRLGFLDQAQLLSRRLGSEPGALGQAVRTSLDIGDTVALSHTLLAGLPTSEFITTNYDDCFERAAAAIGRDVARLPYAPASGATRWLLKMHGCVSAPHDIVLTRQDYVRYAERSAALAGIVQAMLITRHMLFVGFSLDDDNFHRIVDAVRRALAGSRRDALGSAVSLFADPLLEQLWGDDLSWVHLCDRPGPDDEVPLAEAARTFEIFLDCLSFHAAAPNHLLNPRFDALLSDSELELRDRLEPLRLWMRDQAPPAPDDPAASAWARIEALLWDLGAR